MYIYIHNIIYMASNRTHRKIGATEAHGCHAQVPTLDHGALAQGEGERLIASSALEATRLTVLVVLEGDQN